MPNKNPNDKYQMPKFDIGYLGFDILLVIRN